MPPGSNMDDWCTIIRSGMWRLNYKLSSEGKKRFFTEFLPLLHHTKQETLGTRDDDSWYLVYIGTKTAGRGKGYARKLIEYVTRIVSDGWTLEYEVFTDSYPLGGRTRPSLLPRKQQRSQPRDLRPARIRDDEEDPPHPWREASGVGHHGPRAGHREERVTTNVSAHVEFLHVVSSPSR